MGGTSHYLLTQMWTNFNETALEMANNTTSFGDYGTQNDIDWLGLLSVELIEHILIFMSYEDIENLGQCSQRLRDITHNETLWRELASRDYGIMIDKTENLNGKSLRTFYLKVLANFGCLLFKPFRRKDFEYYGGIIKVAYHDFSLYVIELEPPPFPAVMKPLQPQFLCRIAMDQYDTDGVVTFEQETTDFGVIKSLEVTNDSLCQFRIISTPSSSAYMKDLRGEIAAWFEEDSGPSLPQGIIRVNDFAKRFGLPPNMALEKLSDRIEFLNHGIQHCIALPAPKSMQPPSLFAPITPGIFKGTYGPHGIEIISVGYEYEPSMENRCKGLILGEKLYGDRNVPCNQLTFKGYLNKSMTLSKSNQSSIGQIKDYMEGTEETEFLPQDMKPNIQPFILPDDCDCECQVNDELFSTALWRFQASCQIAGDMYNNPEWIDGNVIIFSDDLFGVIFIAENHGFVSLSIYHRVKQNLSAIQYKDVFDKLPIPKFIKHHS